MITILEYIWIDNNGQTRSKTMVLQNVDISLLNLSEWNFDGSSTNQATGNDSEVIIKPVKIIIDPFQRMYTYDSYLVLCDTWLKNGSPHPDNTRVKAQAIFNKHCDENPRYGLEQEFFVTNPMGMPIAWLNGEPTPQGEYYCSNNIQSYAKYIQVFSSTTLFILAGITGISNFLLPNSTDVSHSDLLFTTHICGFKAISLIRDSSQSRSHTPRG